MWAPLQSLAEVAVDPQAIAAGCFVEVEDRFGDRFLSRGAVVPPAPRTSRRFPRRGWASTLARCSPRRDTAQRRSTT